MMKYSKKAPFPPCSSAPHKLKFLFISGGEFTGDLRYVGGDTRLVSVDRRGGITLSRLLSKLSDLHPLITPSSVLKYQLLEPSRTPSSPLVPIASDEEVRRMVEEYDKLLMAAAANGSASRLRVFLCEVKPRLNPNPVADPDVFRKRMILTIENGKARVSRLRKTVISSTGDDSGFGGTICGNNCHLVGKSSHLRRYHYGHDHMNNRENVVRSRAFLVRYQHPFIPHYKSRIHKMTCSNDFGYKNVKGGSPAIVMARRKLHQDLQLTCISPLPDCGTNSRFAMESPSEDISMDRLSLASSAKASCQLASSAKASCQLASSAKASCQQLSYSSSCINIPMKSEAHAADAIVTSRSHYGQIQLDEGDQFGDKPTHEPVFVEGQVSVDRKNEAAYTWKDQGTKSSTISNLVDKKDDVMGGTSICFEEAGKTGCDRLARFSHFADQEIQIINESDIEHIRELGSGAFGTVFYGKWKGSDVAIKRIKPGCFSGGELLEDKLVSDFWKEAHLLSQLHHPNVLAFYGMVTDGPTTSLATVTEYMVNGSLKQVLRRKDRTIDRRKRLIIAMDAAFGMEYLHDRKVVHFDLKSHNLLVNMKDPHRPVCKIGDLGLSKVKRRTLISGGVRGTIPWMAPELLNSENNMVTEKVDVYSFGIVMWELLTGEEPYQNICSEEIIAGILQGNLRPEIPSWCDPAWRSLMEWCWSSDPGSRPSFSKVAKELRTIAASINIK